MLRVDHPEEIRAVVRCNIIVITLKSTSYLISKLWVGKIEKPGNMSHVFQNILPHAARVRFIDGGARESDADDCDDDSYQ